MSAPMRNFRKWLRGRDLNPRPLGYGPNIMIAHTAFSVEEVERVKRERSQGTYDGSIADSSTNQYRFTPLLSPFPRGNPLPSRPVNGT